MRQLNPRRKRAFSLIELVIVVVIIGIIAAIAIPRMSRGAEGAADAALIADLAVMRSAIDLYTTEHIGEGPTTALTFENEMTGFTNVNHLVGAYGTGAPPIIYGPYVRAIPPLPVGPEKGINVVAGAAGAGVGWVYDALNDTITPNTGILTDASGKLYTDY